MEGQGQGRKAKEVVLTLPAEPGETPSSLVLQHPYAGSQESAPLPSLLAAAWGPCTCGCMVAHRVFSFEGTQQKTTALLHSRNCLGRRNMQRKLITGQLNQESIIQLREPSGQNQF